jgi:hypothetical protein
MDKDTIKGLASNVADQINERGLDFGGKFEDIGTVLELAAVVPHKTIAELFADNSIGLYPWPNPNGADSLHCPGCGASQDVKGYVTSMAHITEISHNPDCGLMALYVATLPEA